ncbi:MAG: class Ib ribonucleoside-diphosphate reductase assembly flavoprotein NrdI [Erysipelotrichaceae bacterium]|nr:class Ib ribonucleoside-diphosphate reductase assembly flavoprotein NrdI [Erysipelotrichaceae bacterium]MDO5085641.1 class Ib ribonucleoside-diphosphate reductase assembly flavoprotein NrdI [Erysipelotrichaceae bacterium]
MKVVYMSLTGQTRKFIKKLQADAIEISRLSEKFEIGEPYIMIVPTYDYQVTCIMDQFVDFGNNIQYLRGVCGSGNRNFNDLFCFSAKDLAKKYHVPLLHCFEFHGSDYDVDRIKDEVNKIG